MFVLEHLFCAECFETEIVPRIEMKFREIIYETKTIKHFYLFEWVRGESDLISKLVYQLKSDRCMYALRFYTKILLKQARISPHSVDQINCIVPLPGSTISRVHSEIMADESAQQMGVKSYNILRKQTHEKSQKQSSLTQRRHVQVVVQTHKTHELFTNRVKDKLNILYVDDILTTGSTLKASIEAFGVTESMSMMTLFYRPVLAKTPG